MELQDHYVPELATTVRVKKLDVSDLDMMASSLGALSKDEYFHFVIEHLIFNMSTEVKDSLKMMPRSMALRTLEALYNMCIMHNPSLDRELWLELAYRGSVITTQEESLPIAELESPKKIKSSTDAAPKETPVPKPRQKSVLKTVSKTKYANLSAYLKSKVIGQDEAVDAVVNALKRNVVGLGDDDKTLGVFLFAGSSGVGKTLLAKELHSYLYGKDYSMVRIDCGEYQHKHENQKLLGSPPGYHNHEEGSAFLKAVAANPNTVVLIDEVEKAHPDIFDTFLRLFDEGKLLDNKGREVNFKNTIIIMTTNLGNDKVVEGLTKPMLGFGAKKSEGIEIPKRTEVERLTNTAIKKHFKPEFVNRINKVITFNHLTEQDAIAIAGLELRTVEDKLTKKGIRFEWGIEAEELLVELGFDSVKGARGMYQARVDHIENQLADLLFNTKVPRMSVVELMVRGSEFKLMVQGKRETNG